MKGDIEQPKFPKFMAYLAEKGMDVEVLTMMLNNKGYDYKYMTVLRKLKGETKLYWEDIVAFADASGASESIFFD